MIMDTEKYVKRKKKREKEERAKAHHVWMIEEYDTRDNEWEIAADSDGQYRIFGMRSAARFWKKHEFSHELNYFTGEKRILRVRKYIREVN